LSKREKLATEALRSAVAPSWLTWLLSSATEAVVSFELPALLARPATDDPLEFAMFPPKPCLLRVVATGSCTPGGRVDVPPEGGNQAGLGPQSGFGSPAGSQMKAGANPVGSTRFIGMFITYV
jgi:hypothetical protein